jgi:hypothetical protein
LCDFTPIDIAGLFISAAAHDMDHPGNNNQFEVKTKSVLAAKYSNTSVLENHHLASLMMILEEPECSVLESLSEENLVEIKKQMTANILSTDIAQHAAIQTQF